LVHALDQAGLGENRKVGRVSALDLHEDLGLEGVRPIVLDVDSGAGFEVRPGFDQLVLLLVRDGRGDLHRVAVELSVLFERGAVDVAVAALGAPAAATEVVTCACGQGQGDRGATGHHGAAAPKHRSLHRELLHVLSVSEVSGTEIHSWPHTGPVTRSSPTSVWDSFGSLLVRPGPCRDAPARVDAPSIAAHSPMQALTSVLRKGFGPIQP